MCIRDSSLSLSLSREGELQATKKEVPFESRPERLDRVRLPDAPGQAVSFGNGDMSESSLACFTVPGPRNIMK